MPMCVEYRFVLFLVLSKYLCHQHFVLFWSCWFAIVWQVLAEINEYPGACSGNLRDTTTNLVQSSMYFYIHSYKSVRML